MQDATLLNRLYLCITFFSAGIILIIDYVTPAGVAVGFLYIFLIMLSAFLTADKHIINLVTLVSMLLIAIGYFVGPAAPYADWIRIINRFLSALTVLIAAYIFKRYIDLEKKAETEFQKNLQEANRAEERLRRIIEASPSGILVIDQQGLITLANKEIERLFGYSNDELLGQKIEILIPNRVKKLHVSHRTDFFANPAPRTMGVGRDLFGLRKDGTEFSVEVGLNPLTMQKEKLVLATVIDITERKQAENRFRVVVESAPTAVVMIDKEQKIVLVNAQAEKLFGYAREELFGRNLEMLIPERFRVKHPELVQHFLQKPKARAMGAGRDLYGLKKNGEEIPIEIGLNPATTQDGVYVLASIIDISERKKIYDLLQASEQKYRTLSEDLENQVQQRTIQLEEQRLTAVSLMKNAKAAEKKAKDGEFLLAKTNETLIRTNQELEQFAYIASHDLQEPLRKITSYINIIQEDLAGKLDKETRSNMDIVVRATRRMSDLIRDLLAFSRVWQKELDLKEIDLNQLVQEIVNLLDPSIQATKAIVTQDPLPTLDNLSPLLRQVFQNLLSNALKFISTSRTPKIHITAKEENNCWLFSIEDNGMGIEEKYLENIFQVFMRLHSRDDYPGTGIGLAICKKIIERHGGKIWATSTPDMGTTFYFTIQK